jgi:NADH dehydrogenase
MNILLTGASSGIGRALIKCLFDYPDLKIVAMVHHSLVNISGCEVRKGSLDSPDLLAGVVDGIDTVVHLAALTRSARESEYFLTNVSGTQNLVDACAFAGVKRLIYISSCTASADGGGYARSKLEGEECVKKSGLQWLILRPSEVYGQEAGDTINHLIHWVRRFPFVPVIGTGQARLSPVYIDDVVSAMAQAISDEKLVNETINLAGPEEFTFDELVDRIAKIFGVRRFKLHLPVGFVKFAAVIASGLDLKVLVPDQIPRLLCSKNLDIRKASALISYSPRKLEEGMAGLKKNWNLR